MLASQISQWWSNQDHCARCLWASHQTSYQTFVLLHLLTINTAYVWLQNHNYFSRVQERPPIRWRHCNHLLRNKPMQVDGCVKRSSTNIAIRRHNTVACLLANAERLQLRIAARVVVNCTEYDYRYMRYILECAPKLSRIRWQWNHSLQTQYFT